MLLSDECKILIRGSCRTVRSLVIKSLQQQGCVDIDGVQSRFQCVSLINLRFGLKICFPLTWMIRFHNRINFEFENQTRSKILVLPIQVLDGFCQDHLFSRGNQHIWQEATCQEVSRVLGEWEVEGRQDLVSFSTTYESRIYQDVCESWSECLIIWYAKSWLISDVFTGISSIAWNIFSRLFAMRVGRSLSV